MTILFSEEPAFTLTDDEESALLQSIAEADAGNLLDSANVLKRLG